MSRKLLKLQAEHTRLSELRNQYRVEGNAAEVARHTWLIDQLAPKIALALASDGLRDKLIKAYISTKHYELVNKEASEMGVTVSSIIAELLKQRYDTKQNIGDLL